MLLLHPTCEAIAPSHPLSSTMHPSSVALLWSRPPLALQLLFNTLISFLPED